MIKSGLAFTLTPSISPKKLVSAFTSPFKNELNELFKNDFATYVAKVDMVKNAEIIKGKIAISTSEEN